jgi:hypothetical protein
MPNPTLDTEFSEAHDRYFEAATALVPLLVRVVLARLGEVLPGAQELETEGRFTDDWIRTLRIQRVLDQHGAVLFEVGFGHQTGESRMRSTMSIVSTSTSCSI